MSIAGWTKEEIDRRFREYLGDDADTSREAKRRREILAAGYHLFLKQGYKKTSIDEVATAARVAKGTVYLYFKNKADLLMHCIAFEKQALRGQAEAIFAEETPDRDRLRAWLSVGLKAIRDMPLSARLLTGDHELWDALEDARDTKLDAMRNEGRTLAMQLVELAAPGRFDDEEKGRRVDVLMAITYASASFLDPRNRNMAPLDAFLDTLVEVLFHGVTDAPARGRP